MSKCALITGISGQDGSYLAELLLEKGYQVIGMMRRVSAPRDWRIRHLYEHPNLHIEDGNINDSGAIDSIVRKYKTDEIYNLAAQSYVGASWNVSYNTQMTNGLGTVLCLESIVKNNKDIRFYQASSSEIFGRVRETPQVEETPHYPRSPYGVSKVTAYWNTVNYRESYGLHASNGILFNHESPRRGLEFVTRKITHGLAACSLGLQKELRLGNLDAKRDWGHAKDYVKAMWLMLQQDKGDDYVVATGMLHSIRDVLNVAAKALGIDWYDFVVQDERFMRPAEVDLLLGNSRKARVELGWAPKYSFKELIEEMVEEDLRLLKGNGKTR